MSVHVVGACDGVVVTHHAKRRKADQRLGS
jgi:hypothetical protein